MIIKLKKNERLIYAGNAPLRAPNGEPLPAVPQYIIVAADEADPAAVREVQKGERVALVGKAFNDYKSAEERFAALKAGRATSPPEVGVPLYILTGAESVNPTKGLTHGQEQACADIAKDLTATFAMHMRKIKAAERQSATP